MKTVTDTTSLIPTYVYKAHGTECKDEARKYDITSNEYVSVGCTECHHLFYLKSDYTCAKCDEKCKNGCVKESTYCINYDPYEEIEGCSIYSDDHSTCLECEPHTHKLVNGQCLETSYDCVDGYSYIDKHEQKCMLCSIDGSDLDVFQPEGDCCLDGVFKIDGASHVMTVMFFLLVVLLI